MEREEEVWTERMEEADDLAQINMAQGQESHISIAEQSRTEQSKEGQENMAQGMKVLRRMNQSWLKQRMIMKQKMAQSD